jgi:hypothetical protein
MGEAVVVSAKAKGSVKEAKWTLKRVDDLVRIVNQSYLELCELLYKVRENEWFKILEGSDGDLYHTFEEYVADRLGWKNRKGQYFVKIQKDLMLPAGLKREDLVGVEYTKAEALAGLPAEEKEPAKIKGWLEEARTTPVKQLRAKVNKVREKVEKDKVFKTDADVVVQFYLAPEQAKNVNLAVQVAQKIAGGDAKRGHALDMVCLDFLSGRIEESKMTLRRLLKRAEDVFGVKIMALEEKGSEMEIAYGDKIAAQFGIEVDRRHRLPK